MTCRLRSAVTGVVLALLLAVFAISAATPRAVSAHPLGNFTVNTYSRLELYGDAIRVRYVLDMAEIPAFQERQRIDTNDDEVVSTEEADAYVAGRLPALLQNVALTLDGTPLTLEAASPALTFQPGEAGLETLRLTFWIDAPLAAGIDRADVRYTDTNYRDRLGWRELIVQPHDSEIGGAVLTDDPTNELREYPADRLKSPRVTRQLAFSFTPGSTSAPALAASTDQLTSEVAPIAEAEAPAAVPQARRGFAALIAPERVTLPLAIIALLAATTFGAVHALEPGHGKTLVAAYFVGTRGTAPQAVLLGLIVAATHTVGVFAIGTVTLVGSKYILPEDLYPWLSAASGLVLAAIGLALLRPRLAALARRRLSSDARHATEPHAHDGHHHHTHGHHHGPGGHTHAPLPESGADGPPWRGLVALGLADGLVPTPSTLVVLLAAVSLDRVALGLGLIAAFSLGFGAVLTALALAFVYARRWFARVDLGASAERSVFGFASRLPVATTLPVIAALVLVAVGLTLSARSIGDVL